MSLFFRTLSRSTVALLLSASMVWASTNLSPEIPDGQQTPGSLCSTKDKDYSGVRYGERIPYCRRNVSTETKVAIYEQYGIEASRRKHYTIDHFIPLSIGGSNKPENLWPEHKKIKALRQNLEMDVYQDLQEGVITQEQALSTIREAKLHPPLH
jgi:hypothetical protein